MSYRVMFLLEISLNSAFENQSWSWDIVIILLSSYKKTYVISTDYYNYNKISLYIRYT